MKLLIAKHMGFCSGVHRAVNLAIEESKKRPVVTLGPLLHNTQFTEKLEADDIHIIDDISQSNGKPIITRSHGVPMEILRKARMENLPLIEGTCPFVKHAQKAAKQLKNEGYKVVIVGNPNHSEVIGINSFTNYESIIINSLEEAKTLPHHEKIGIVSQTTQNREKFSKIIEELKNHCDEIKVIDTICNVTKERQDEAAKIAKQSDVMIIIGGRHSSNTKKLFEICKEITTSYHIETSDEIEMKWFKDAGTVGIAAGASTPDYIINAVIEKLSVL